MGLAVYYYFTGAAATLPLLLVPHLLAQPLTLQTLAVGPLALPVQASGFVVSLTHDLAGPFAQPAAATWLVALLAGALAGWVAVATTLRRTAFVAALVPVIFLLMSLNLDLVGVFSVEKQYFLALSLALVGGLAFGLHAYGERVPLAGRVAQGAALMAGLLTRLSAAVTMGFSVVLMLMFGWQGATCIDEWTMAACNLAMGATLLLAGSGAYSLDNVLLRRNPALARRSWFRWLGGSLPLPMGDLGFRNLGLVLLAAVAAFDIGTYSYYRGSVVTPFHGGPVSPTKHHFALSDGAVLPDGGLRFHIYLDGGTPEAPAHVMKAELLGPDGKVQASWDTKALSTLPPASIHNDFAYNKFKAGPYGLVATMGAMATVTLPPPATPSATPAQTAATLRLTDVNGRSFTATLAPAARSS